VVVGNRTASNSSKFILGLSNSTSITITIAGTTPSISPLAILFYIMEVMLKHDVLIEGAQITRTWLKDVLSVLPPQLVMSQGTSDHEICVGIHLLMMSHVSDDLMFGLLLVRVVCYLDG
jgi:hypothetical protein